MVCICYYLFFFCLIVQKNYDGTEDNYDETEDRKNSIISCKYNYSFSS